MDNKNVFSKNLNYYMKAHSKSRRDICEALGFSYYTVTDWVKGKKYPRMDKVEMLANYFGILKSDLIEDKTAESKEKLAGNDELSENVKKLVDFAKSVPEDKVELVLKLMRTIVEDD